MAVSSLRYVISTCEAIGALAQQEFFSLVVVTSTVMPGSRAAKSVGAGARQRQKRCGERLGLCYSPEFIALGTVIRDFLNPDFLLIGNPIPRRRTYSPILRAHVQKLGTSHA